MSMYEDIVKVMSDGKERTSRQIAQEMRPDAGGTELHSVTSKVSSIVARKARIWGEFEEVGSAKVKGKLTKVWRMVL